MSWSCGARRVRASPARPGCRRERLAAHGPCTIAVLLRGAACRSAVSMLSGLGRGGRACRCCQHVRCPARERRISSCSTRVLLAGKRLPGVAFSSTWLAAAPAQILSRVRCVKVPALSSRNTLGVDPAPCSGTGSAMRKRLQLGCLGRGRCTGALLLGPRTHLVLPCASYHLASGALPGWMPISNALGVDRARDRDVDARVRGRELASARGTLVVERDRSARRGQPAEARRAASSRASAPGRRVALDVGVERPARVAVGRAAVPLLVHPIQVGRRLDPCTVCTR